MKDLTQHGACAEEFVSVRKKDPLPESERRIREALQHIALPAVNLDSDGNITFINNCLLELTGWDHDEVIGKSWFSIFIPEGQELSKMIFDTSMRNGSIVARYENDIVTRTGDRLFIAWKNSPVRDPDGKLTGMSSIGEDLTERKRTEQLLMESEERYRVLYENNHTVMLLIDLQSGAIVDANPAAISFYGYSRDDLLGMNISEISLLRAEERAKKFDMIRQRQSHIGFNSTHRLRDGRVRDVELHCTLLRIQGRKTVHAIVHDTTEKNLTEQALKASQERFRHVFDQSDEAILLARHATGEIVYANEAVKKILGVETADLVWKQVSQIIHLFPGQYVLDALSDLSRRADIILPRVTKPGRTDIVVSIRLRLIDTGAESLIHITFRDITDRIRLEEEAKAAQAKLFHANKLSSLGILVSGIAHEINNPNNFIMFNSEMLSDIWQDVSACLDETQQERPNLMLAGLPYEELRGAVPKLLSGLVEGSRRIRNIIDGLRQFSQQDAGARRQFDLNDTVLKATAMLAPQVKKHTDRFSMQLAEDLPPVVGMPEQIQQVVINLGINALQSLQARTDGVCISTAREGDEVIIRIADEGGGMDVETLARVSEPFFTTKEASGGTGLGIFISQSLIAEHRGVIEFDSFKGEGTTATIRLPIPLDPSEGALR